MPPPAASYLSRHWGLPEAGMEDVERLIEARRSGSTALTMPLAGDPAARWGRAVVSAGPGRAPVRPAPLVYWSDGDKAFLQSWRDHALERRIAASLRRRAAAAPGAEGIARPQSALGIKAEAPQTLAVQRLLGKQILLLTGGPGTGKTYTAARACAQICADAPRAPRIALVAPTGKAAERLGESMRQALASLPDAQAAARGVLEPAAAAAGTLHHWLGYNPAQGRCERCRDQPLDLDLLVLDEASMVDTALWGALLDALPESARLLVLGDPQQLESVGAGSVLEHWMRAAASSDQLRSCHVHLERSHRFANRPDIAALANALSTGDSAAAESIIRRCHGNTGGGVSWAGDRLGKGHGLRALPPELSESFLALTQASDPSAALNLLGRARILTANREGSMGAAGINAWVDAEMERALKATGREMRYRPVIVLCNDPASGLSNGSIGVVESRGGEARAWFPSTNGTQAPRSVRSASLPEHERAWAMTIHRSQGSEFDHVLAILPKEDSPLATRELIYTAITRAKQTVALIGDSSAVAHAAACVSQRVSLLADLLLDPQLAELRQPTRTEREIFIGL